MVKIASSVQDLTPDSYYGSLYMDADGLIWVNHFTNDSHL